MVDLAPIRAFVAGELGRGSVERWREDEALLLALHGTPDLLAALVARAPGEGDVARLVAECCAVGGDPMAALSALAARVNVTCDEPCFERLAEIFCDDPLLASAVDAVGVHLLRPGDAPVRARRLALAAAMFRVAAVHGEVCAGGSTAGWTERTTTTLAEAVALDPGVVGRLPRHLAVLLRPGG